MTAALGWCPLQQERTEDKLVMIYRDNGLIDVPADQFLRPATFHNPVIKKKKKKKKKMEMCTVLLLYIRSLAKLIIIDVIYSI